MPDRLNKPRAGFSTEGDRVEILAKHTDDNIVLVHFYAPDLDKSGDICLKTDEAWQFASDVIASAMKLNPEFVPSLMEDLDARLKLLEERNQDLLDEA